MNAGLIPSGPKDLIAGAPAVVAKLGVTTAWFSIGEAMGLGIKFLVPSLPVDGNVLGHAVGGLFAALDVLGWMPHRRNVKRCLSHANDLFTSGLI